MWLDLEEWEAVRRRIRRRDALEGARIQAELQTAGDRIPIGDVMIVGVARNRGATLVAGDAHFERIEGLDVENHRS